MKRTFEPGLWRSEASWHAKQRRDMTRLMVKFRADLLETVAKPIYSAPESAQDELDPIEQYWVN